MLAVAAIPRTFQRSLLPRSTADQGIVTSITVVLVYMLGLLTQDVLEGATRFVSPSSDDTEKEDSENTWAPLLVSAAAVGAGILLQKILPYEEDEKLPRSTARTASKWVAYAGTAGLIIEGIEAANSVLSKDKEAAENRDLLPYFLGAGLLYSLFGEYMRAKQDDDFSLKQALGDSKPARVIGITAGVTALLGGLVYTERFVAKNVDKALDTPASKLKLDWIPFGHVVGLGIIGGGLYALLKNTYGKIEHGAEELETGFTKRPNSRFVSGGIGSPIDWGTLSVQGRRHAGTTLTAAQITSVMGEPALNPIRIFVGLDSAETESDRVTLALNELERMHAYDRKYILVVSPTGTGYVNYVMSESVEYQTRGNVASVTLQYSKRPSPMSLDRVDEGHAQYRMLLNGISKRIRKMPASKRPKILLFGESLGAWTSQDAFMNSGTDGLEALQIDRALWIGTPKGSKWKEQALFGNALNVEHGLVGTFDNYEQVEALDKTARNALRYVMVTHYNDPIAQFGLELLVKQPDWVADESKRPEGVSKNTEYRSPALFVQTLVDMKNALKPIPGEFVASGHDYRADLARFVSFSYGLKITESQLTTIEKALRKNEINREKRIRGEA